MNDTCTHADQIRDVSPRTNGWNETVQLQPVDAAKVTILVVNSVDTLLPYAPGVQRAPLHRLARLCKVALGNRGKP